MGGNFICFYAVRPFELTVGNRDFTHRAGGELDNNQITRAITSHFCIDIITMMLNNYITYIGMFNHSTLRSVYCLGTSLLQLHPVILTTNSHKANSDKD